MGIPLLCEMLLLRAPYDSFIVGITMPPPAARSWLVRLDLGCPDCCGRDVISIGTGIVLEHSLRACTDRPNDVGSGVEGIEKEWMTGELSSERGGLKDGVRKKSVMAVSARSVQLKV